MPETTILLLRRHGRQKTGGVTGRGNGIPLPADVYQSLEASDTINDVDEESQRKQIRLAAGPVLLKMIQRFDKFLTHQIILHPSLFIQPIIVFSSLLLLIDAMSACMRGKVREQGISSHLSQFRQMDL